MAIRNCPKCEDPNFDDKTCGCGWCKKCFWREACTRDGWYDENFGKPLAERVFAPAGDFVPTGGFGDPVIVNDAFAVKHTWVSWEDGDHSPYICKCGVKFDTHDLLMAHTAALNPSIDTFDMGVAGVAVEREAHKKTLALLKRARDIMLTSNDHYLIGFVDLLNDIKKQCPVFEEEDSKGNPFNIDVFSMPKDDDDHPYEKTGFGD